MPWNRRRRQRSVAGGGRLLLLATAVLLPFLAAGPATAQKPKVETYAIGDGLPTLAITGLAQDANGRLWILSHSGISVYDGQAFAPAEASGLPEEELGALEIDAADNVWTVTRWSGPQVYRLDGGLWRPLPAPASGEPARGLTSLAVLPGSDTIAVGSVHRGLWLWDGAAWTHHDVAGGVPDAGVRALAVWGDAIAVGTDAGLCLVEGRRLDCRLREREPRLKEPIFGLTTAGAPPKLWLFSASWLGHLEGDRLRVSTSDIRLPRHRAHGSLLVDAIGGVYFGIEQQLFFTGPEHRRVVPLGLREGLATDGVTSLLLDRESNVWVASLRGMSRIESRRFLTFDRDAGLLEDEVSAVIEPTPGELILGHNRGLSFFDGESVEPLLFERTPDTAIDAFRVMDMALDHQGRVWIAAHRKGLLRLGADRTLETRLTAAIMSVERDSEGRLWACSFDSLFGPGAPLGGAGDRLTRIEHGHGDVGGLRWLVAGTAGQLYVSTAQGLLWTDGETWRMARGPTTQANILYGLLASASGEVWVGTRAGLYRLEGGGLVAAAAEQRIDQPVYLIVEDRRGWTWFGTGDGVRVWDGRELRHLSVRHGLAGWETNRGAGWVDHAGRVWIGTDRGVSMYQESYDVRREVAPRVEIRALEVNGDQLAGAGDGLMEHRIDLGYRQNNLVFQIDTVAFSSEEKVLYRYRLDGFEEAWQGPAALPPAGIRYTNLSPGAYRFRIIAGWQGGARSDEATSAPIVIARPFWRRAWFYLLAAASVAALGLAVHGYRTRNIRAHNLELSALNDRLRRLLAEREELIEDLETKNVELERFTYTVSHDLKSPLVTIRGFLGYLVRDAAAGETERMQRDIERIEAATATMGRLLDELLELSRIGRMINSHERVGFAELAEQAVELASGQIAERGVEVQIAPDLPDVSGDRVRLLEVVQNLVENAVKFMGDQPSPRIEIGVRRDDEGGSAAPEGSQCNVAPEGRIRNTFYVADNGIGIQPRYQEKVFGLFERLDQTVEGTGVGLAIVKRIVEFHGGRIWVESEGVGQGSAFCFTLPAG